MCDYSLAGIPSRLAVENEQLVVHQFATGTLGLAASRRFTSQWWSPKQTPAVCVPPGARLLLRNIPMSLQQKLSVGAIEEVTFTQLSATPYQYRDALRFNNGREVLLQKLQCGQEVEVLSLSSGDFEREEHQRLEEEYQRLFLG